MADQILALAKRIKNTNLNCGIYKIACKSNGRFYIGSSTEIARRLRAHRHGLRGKYHPNVKIQASWDKYGESDFSFAVLMCCAESDLLFYEQMLIDEFSAVENGFNLALSALAPMAGRSHSTDARARIGAAVRGRIDGPETSIRRSKSAKARGEATSEQMREMWKTRDQSVIDKIAASNTGQKRSSESCANIGAATKRKWESDGYREKFNASWAERRAMGWTMPDEARAKMSESSLKTWQDPEYREKIRAVHVGRKNTEETKAKMRASALAREARKREAATSGQ